MRSSVWTAVALVFLVWAVGATVGLAQFYQTSQNQAVTINNLQSVVNELQGVVGNISIRTTIGVDYGNGTITWYNNTYAPIGSTLLNQTMRLASVTYDVYPFGIWVNGINGVRENASAGQYWMIYSWSSGNWIELTVGAADYTLSNGEIVKWALTKF